METGGFVSYDSIDFERILSNHRCICDYCMGVKIMPDKEELEERLNTYLDDQAVERMREAIRKLDVERLDEIFSKGGAED